MNPFYDKRAAADLQPPRLRDLIGDGPRRSVRSIKNGLRSNKMRATGKMRRWVLALGGAGLLGMSGPGGAQIRPDELADLDTAEIESGDTETGQRPNWQRHFQSLEGGALLVELGRGRVHYWPESTGADGTGYRQFAVTFRAAAVSANSAEWRGKAAVIRKLDGPTWRAAADLRARMPGLPASLRRDPANPLGGHAIHLAGAGGLRLHGSPEAGDLPGDGIGLPNEQIAELFALVGLGTQVLVL
jgi:hypothetical protein